MRTVLAILLAVLAPTTYAQVAVQQTADTKPMDLFRAAIDSPTGSIRTQVYGQLALKVQQAIGAPGTPVFAEVKTIESFKEEGCKRLAMTLSAPSHLMKTSDGGSRPFAATWRLNICRDGRPPTDSIDLSKAAGMFDKGDKPVQLQKAK